MKTYKKYILGLALISAAALTGCKDKMRELNSDQTSLQSTDPRFMFYGATQIFDERGRSFCADRVSSIGRFVQYFIASGGGSPYPSASDLSIGSPWPGAYWDLYHTGQGRLLNTLCDYVKGPTLSDLEKQQYEEIGAISKVLQTYLAWRVFDVYGAAVYSQAFKAADGITNPEYDLFQDVYKELDAVVKTQVDILKQPAPAGTVSLGKYDPMYGLVVKVNATGGCTISELGNADVQRARWTKFANSFRLKMAYRVKAKDGAHFQTVLNEVLDPANGGMISSNDESCIVKFPETAFVNNTNESNQVTYYQRSSLSFVNSLKVMDDPRLPLLVRANFVDTSFAKGSNGINFGYTGSRPNTYKWMYTHFPDSLAKYGNMFELHNVYQGPSMNSYAYQQAWVPGVILRGTGSFTFGAIKNPNYPNPMISPVTGEELTLPTTGSPFVDESFTPSIWVASLPQGRYWVKNGGQGYDYDDKPSVSNELIRLTRPVIAYDEHCFTMALISNELGGAIGGKTTDEWYKDGVRANMVQLNEDAKRVYIAISTATNYPLLPPWNGTSEADKHLYDINSTMIDDYITALGNVGDKSGSVIEDIMTQTWFAMYLNPEEMWGFWKLTGYPRSLQIPVKTGTGAFGESYKLPTIPGWELTFTSGNEATAMARRATVPGGQAEIDNGVNYRAMKSALEATPGYGTWNVNTGRIWWDITPAQAPVLNPPLD